MKKKMALALTLAMLLTMFVGVQAFAANPGVTLSGVYAGSTQVVVTYDATVVAAVPNPTYIGVALYGHATAFSPQLWTGPVNGTCDLIAANGTLTLNLAEPLVEGTDVRFVIGNPSSGYVYVVAVKPLDESTLGGDTDIEITAPDPLNILRLISPEDQEANDVLAGFNVAGMELGDVAFKFDKYKYSDDPQVVEAINFVSVVHQYKEVSILKADYEIRATIGDFLTADGDAIFDEFVLTMTNDAYANIEGASSLSLASGETVIVLGADEIGYGINNYSGKLSYLSNPTYGVNKASAVFTWEIGFAV